MHLRLIPLALIVLFLLLPLVMWSIRARLFRPPHRFAKLFLITVVAGYALWVGSSVLLGFELKADLNRFDLNGDGFFTGPEITPELSSAMLNSASDTGRQLAPFVAAPLSVIWVSLNFAVFALVGWLGRAIRGAMTQKPAAL